MDIDVASLSQSTASGAGYAESRPGTLTGDGSLLTPVREHIRGRCLDLGATSEAWTQELESLATEVVTAAEFADASIHGPFDTVVGACQPATLAGMATTARQALGDDGLVVLGIDGWAQHLRTETQSATRALAALPRGNAWYIRRTLRRVGFKELTLYGVFPSIAEPKFIYPLADDTAVEWFIENRLTGWMDVAARVAHTAGMFEEGQLGYLAVCDGATDGTGPESAVTRVSYNRVVTFEFDGRHLARVRKAPRPSAGDATIRREQRVLDDLLNESTRAAVPTAVTSALPVGSLTASPTGAVRVESPVGGKPIGTWLDTDPVAVRNVLDTAFEWLASFQIAYRGRRVVREPDELRHRSRCPVLGVRDPPAYNSSVVSFVAPCHGDFHPWNV